MEIKIMIAKIRLLTVIGLLALVPVSQALANGYVLLSAGNSKDIIFDDSDIGYKIGVGMNFTDYLAAELAYVDLGEFSAFGGEFSQTGLTASLIPTYKMNEDASVFAKIGLMSWTFEYSSNFAPSGEETGSDMFYGLGFEYKVGNTASVVAEYERYDIADGDVDLLSVGVKIGF